MTVRLQTYPERSTPIVRGLLSIALSSRLERGCMRSEVLIDASDSSQVRYLEDWEEAEQLILQIRSEQFTRLLAQSEAAAAPPQFEFRFIEEIRGIDYVIAHRGLGSPDSQ